MLLLPLALLEAVSTAGQERKSSSRKLVAASFSSSLRPMEMDWSLSWFSDIVDGVGCW